MSYQIDMINVKNADCLIADYIYQNKRILLLVDGGNKGDSENIINHIARYYIPFISQFNAFYVLNTHPDKDHIGGLAEIIKAYSPIISNVVMHLPIRHFSNLGQTTRILESKANTPKLRQILESLQDSISLQSICDTNQISIVEPFVDNLQNSEIPVLSPSIEFYENMLSQFSNIGKMNDYIEKVQLIESDTDSDIFDELSPSTILDAENETTPENESSVIFRLTYDGKSFLFCGDAGVAAFTDMNERRVLQKEYWMKVPHHGSRRNLTSGILQIINPEEAWISAVGDNKHPRRALINYLKSIDCNVYSTHKSGSLWRYSSDMPQRSNYKEAEKL